MRKNKEIKKTKCNFNLWCLYSKGIVGKTGTFVPDVGDTSNNPIFTEKIKQLIGEDSTKCGFKYKTSFISKNLTSLFIQSNCTPITLYNENELESFGPKCVMHVIKSKFVDNDINEEKLRFKKNTQAQNLMLKGEHSEYFFLLLLSAFYKEMIHNYNFYGNPNFMPQYLKNNSFHSNLSVKNKSKRLINCNNNNNNTENEKKIRFHDVFFNIVGNFMDKNSVKKGHELNASSRKQYKLVSSTDLLKIVADKIKTDRTINAELKSFLVERYYSKTKGKKQSHVQFLKKKQ